MKIFIKALKGILWIIFAWQVITLFPAILWLKNPEGVTGNMWAMLVIKSIVLIVCYALYKFLDKKYKAIPTTKENMRLFKKVKLSSAKSRVIEDDIYEQVADELAHGEKKGSIWVKALADSDGADDKAKSLYIKYRVQSIKDERDVSEVIRKQEIKDREVDRKVQIKNDKLKKKAEKERQIKKQKDEINESILALKNRLYLVKKTSYGWLVTNQLNRTQKKINSVKDLHKYTNERREISEKNSKFNSDPNFDYYSKENNK